MKIQENPEKIKEKYTQKSVAWCTTVPCTHHAAEALWRSVLRVVRAAISVMRPLLSFLSIDLVGDPPVNCHGEGMNGDL